MVVILGTFLAIGGCAAGGTSAARNATSRMQPQQIKNSSTGRRERRVIGKSPSASLGGGSIGDRGLKRKCVLCQGIRTTAQAFESSAASEVFGEIAMRFSSKIKPIEIMSGACESAK